MYEDKSYDMIKIIDFGESVIKSKKRIKDQRGTLEYCAPEVMQEFMSYDQKCDVWSCGVIMFILLTGKFPYSSDN